MVPEPLSRTMGALCRLSAMAVFVGGARWLRRKRGRGLGEKGKRYRGFIGGWVLYQGGEDSRIIKGVKNGSPGGSDCRCSRVSRRQVRDQKVRQG
jgi:hypothetical protein